MPSMSDIYKSHSFQYDELVSREDFQGNLPEALERIFSFDGKEGFEFGVGTGRLTRMYLDRAKHVRCFDRSPHMLEKAKKNLEQYQAKVSFELCDNLEIQTLRGVGDFVIEGWSFGHAVIDHHQDLDETVAGLVSGSLNLLRDGGKLIIIETLGTNVETPGVESESLNRFYSLLEGRYQMTRTTVRTDYRFRSVDEACRIMGFFFGDDMRRSVEARGSVTVPEFTGIWSAEALNV